MRAREADWYRAGLMRISSKWLSDRWLDQMAVNSNDLRSS